MLRAKLLPPTVELHFLIEDVGPGTNRLCELEPGDELLLVGPLGNGFASPRRRSRAAARRGRGGDRAAGHLAGRARAAGPRPSSASGTAPVPKEPRFCKTPPWPPTTAAVGHHGLVTDLLEAELDERGEGLEVYACGPPAMLEAVRAMCMERAVPAQLALESGMACGFGACFGCVVPTVDGYVRLCLEGPGDSRRGVWPPRSPSRERDIDRRVLRDRAGPPDHQRVGHVRRDRRPSSVRRGADRALPVRGVRVQDRDARASPGQPAAAPVGARRRADQLDRPSQQGPARLPRARPARAGDAAGAADRQRDGLEPRSGGRARQRLRRAQGGGCARAQRVLPERRDRPR